MLDDDVNPKLTIENYNNYLTGNDQDNSLVVIREHTTEDGSRSAENRLIDAFDLDERDEYPSGFQSVACGLFGNSCSSSELPNSNTASRELYESSGYEEVSVDELEEIQRTTDAKHPGMLPEDRAPRDFFDEIQSLLGIEDNIEDES